MELGKVANFLGTALPGFFISIYGQDSPTPFFCTGVAYGAILIVSMILLYTNSWERPNDEVENERAWQTFLKASKSSLRISYLL